jgi:hypothetical protein
MAAEGRAACNVIVPPNSPVQEVRFLMPFIVTTVHDAAALAATCRWLGLDAPTEGSVQLNGRAASGWVVRLPGLHAPLVFDTLSGLVAYHVRDNAHGPYARIMRFIYRYYDVRAQLSRSPERAAFRRSTTRKGRRPSLVGAVAC